MKQDAHEPQPPALTPSPWSLPAGATRHDGWTGERMATFCETLAETGLVVDACLAAGKSRQNAYALRHRDPVFAAAWEAALAMARSQLSDALLARSLEGSVEHYYRDGELIGERRHYESWLALSVLNRLDKRADLDRSEGGLPSRMTADWLTTLDALRSGGSTAVPALIAPKGDESDESDSTPSPSEEEDQGLDLSDRCWKSDEAFGELIWMTDFPPPEGYDGYESGAYGSSRYERECTAEEVAVLDADEAAADAALRADDAELRDEWFKLLNSELPSASERSAEQT